MKGEDKRKDHSDHKDRKLVYYKKTIQLLTIGLEVFFLFFVAAIIFLFVATDDATRFEAENQQLLVSQQNLQNQINNLENQVLSSSISSDSSLDNGLFTRSFFIDDEVFTVSVSLNDTLDQVQRGFQRREFIEDYVIPMHTTYAQTCYDFALYCSNNPQDVLDLRSFYTDKLTEVRNDGPQYLILPLGVTEKSVMDFRDYIDSTGFEEEVSLLRNRYSDDEEFIESLWFVVSQMTTYSREIEETPLYPLETLLLGGGDCEDSAILFASLLNSIDHDWEVSFLYTDLNNPAQPRNFNHVLVHVDTGDEEFFVETTSKEIMNPYSQVLGEYIRLT